MIKYLLDKIIVGEIDLEDIEKMRKKTGKKLEKKKDIVKCDICENEFANKHDLKLHITKNHEDCILCESFFSNKAELKTHQINVHNEIKSPVSKKSKVKEGNDDDVSCIDNVSLTSPHPLQHNLLAKQLLCPSITTSEKEKAGICVRFIWVIFPVFT